MFSTVLVVYATLVMVVLSEDPTCGHCRCRVLHDDTGTATTMVSPVLLVNCSDDRYFPGRLRAPKLTADDAALPIWAEFRRNRYTYIGDDFLLPRAERLSLADNEIYNLTSRAFSSMRQLRNLSLARNRLDFIDGEIFHGLGGLEVLDLSHNLLGKIPEGTFTELSSLTTLLIASNYLEVIGPEFFRGLDKLQTVDLSSNAIVDIKPDAFSSLLLLQHLTLSGNLISDMTKDHFVHSKMLESLDLSHNAISNLDPDILKDHDSLQKIMLSGNQLTTAFNLPGSVTYLGLTDNHVEGVQNMWKDLENLEELHVANTSIASLNGTFNAKNLQVINISMNSLDNLPLDSLPALRILDVSWNNLSSIPKGVTAVKLPSLRDLYLDGNPIEQLVFPTSELVFKNLQVISLSGNPVLQDIRADVFSEVTSSLSRLTLSHNPLLASVHESAFAAITIKELDLSWNALSSLPQGLLPWSQLESVNLQYNPWDCECSMQWFLDIIVSRLYITHQDLLYELRCASPAPLRDRRMVHFYNWTQKAFCMQFEQLRMNPLDGSDNVDTAAIGSSTTAIIVVLSLLAALIVMIVVGVLLQRRISSRRRIRNRRF